MTTPQDEEEGILREWAPLSKFLHQIPLRSRHGLFLENVDFTCVAADVDCIVLGTSCGLIFWYNRASHDVQPLRSEKSLSPITCVAVVSSVEYMVAAGDKLGVISIFRVPKDIPDWISGPKEKQMMERYTIDEVHSSGISALTWSTNGQKLFSGDDSGVVVFTEVDHRMRITRACEVVNETFKIVQLSYCQHRQSLVVSTNHRCIVCHYEKPNWRILQVGQRERHCLQELGACFIMDENRVPSIYCCRAGLRLWKTDLDGNVLHTVKFKDVVAATDKPVKFLHQLKPTTRAGTVPKEFGKLYHWRDGLLISHWEDTVLVLDPSTIRVVATIKNCNVDITCVAPTQREIFLIFGHRELIRLSYFPDEFVCSLGGLGNLASGEPVTVMPKLSFNIIDGLPIVLSSIQNSRIKLTARTANSEPRTNEVSFGVESTPLPFIAAVSEGVPELRLDSSRQHQFSSIGQEEFDEIIYSKPRLKKPKRHKAVVLDSNRNSGEFNSDEFASESGSSLAESLIEVECGLEEPASIHEVEACSLPIQLLIPDRRPIDEIVEDFKLKEEILESTIVYPPPLDDLSPASESNNTVIENFKSCNGHNTAIKESEELGEEMSDITNAIDSSIAEAVNSSSEGSSGYKNDYNFETVSQRAEDEVKTDSIFMRSSDEIVSLNGSDGSCSSVDQTVPIEQIEKIYLSDKAASETVVSTIKIENTSMASESSSSIDEPLPSIPVLYQSLQNGWTEMSCPDHPSWISAYSEGVVMCSSTFKVYVCDSNSWVKLPYEASHVFPSPDGQVGVKLHYSSAYYSYDWRTKSNWKLLSRDVNSVYMENDKLWFVSQGDLYYMHYCSELVDRIRCPFKLLKIYGDSETLYAISREHVLLIKKNEEWLPVWSFPGKIKYFACGPNKLRWTLDLNDRLSVTDDLRRSWWQVIVADSQSYEQSLIAANDSGIYVANARHDTIVWNNTSVSAISWSLSGVKVDCVQMSAEGVFEDKGCVWVLCKGNRLIAIPPTLDSIHHIKTPCKIVSFACRPQVLWLLSEDGEIFFKQGITDSNPVGSDWKKMDCEQLREKQMQIIHLSCGFDVVWACDIRGNVLMLVGSPHAISNCSFTPAWVLVDGSALQNRTFTKVYVGPQCHMVWALDDAGNVYVREAIFPALPVGTSWVHVPGLNASHLSISTETVWALGHGGIYRRTGITENNFIGDVWTCIDIASDNLSVTVDEKLLSVEDGRLRRFDEMLFPFSDEIVVEKDWTLL